MTSGRIDMYIIQELNEDIQRAKDKLAAYQGRCAGFADALIGSTLHRNVPMAARELHAYQRAYDEAQKEATK